MNSTTPISVQFGLAIMQMGLDERYNRLTTSVWCRIVSLRLHVRTYEPNANHEPSKIYSKSVEFLAFYVTTTSHAVDFCDALFENVKLAFAA